MKHAKKRRRSSFHLTRYLLVAVVLVIVIGYVYFSRIQYDYRVDDGAMLMSHYDITQKYLTKNAYSRPGIRLRKVNGIVVHYTANQNSTALENRDYFESLATNHKTHASSHFIIGIDGEIIQCIPLTEISYASNSRNGDTISIECCYKDESGKFTNETYKSLVALVKDLMDYYSLDHDDVIRHYDITGKLCPIYFVRNPQEWTRFKENIDKWTILGLIYY